MVKCDRSKQARGNCRNDDSMSVSAVIAMSRGYPRPRSLSGPASGS